MYKRQHYHCANSAAILDLPETYMDIVRSGISTYGLYPSDEVDQQHVHLKPAMELISHVSHVKWVEAVSYTHLKVALWLPLMWAV